MKKLFALMSCLLLLGCWGVSAQKIDFNKSGRPDNEGLEPGYQPWPIGQMEVRRGQPVDPGANAVSATFGQLKLTLSCAENGSEAVLATNYWKPGITLHHAKLVGDAAVVYQRAYRQLNNAAVRLDLTIEGFTPGEHSVQAFHNNVDGMDAPDIDVYVNDRKQLSGVKQTNRQLLASESGHSYVKFNVAAGQKVKISYVTAPQQGQSYGTTSISLNALLIDQSDFEKIALNPAPADQDMHADADKGSIKLAWTASASAVKHHVYFGSSADKMAEVAVLKASPVQAGQRHGALTAYTVREKVNANQPYFWRIDEEDAAGQVHQGDVWSFRPRRLAFPGAEGHGRFAIGGRDGVVYHVTSLEDNPRDPQPGTFRYGITKLSGPRTIVFDVAGVIELKGRLSCSEKYITVAGQTAPGNGIMLRGAPFGMTNDGITRFMRMRLGHINSDGVLSTASGNGLDGMGMAGSEHAIMDHCSISWTIDEGFSSRNAKTLTLQRTMISEALNIAEHPHYQSGKTHGYAATIGGGSSGGVAGSFHHNLMVHNEGRNWSLSGGLDGAGFYDGHHDLYNNVCYNWGGRATDGGTHEGNFVNNYYKMGPATTWPFLLNAQLEGTGKGSQAYYVSGNIRENRDGSKTQDALGETYKYSVSGGQKVDWEVFVDKPYDFFNPEGNVESAQAAWHNVLSDVGCNQPVLDLHDQRMIRETLEGTSSTKGSRSGKPGLIDSEEDEGCEGFDMEKLGIVKASRPAGWDSDQDGIPNWFEQLCGTDPQKANNRSDRNNDGYTDLEEYLNWLAEPHFVLRPGQTAVIGLQPYFAGYGKDFKVKVSAVKGLKLQKGGTATDLSLAAPAQKGLYSLQVTCSNNEGISLTRTFNFAVTDSYKEF